MSLENLDMEAVMQLNALMQNNTSESEPDYDDDEFLSEYDDYDDDEFDDYDDDDEFDEEFAEFDDYDDDDEFIGRWIRKRRDRIRKRRENRIKAVINKVRPIPRRRVNFNARYATKTDLSHLVRSTNKRISALKRAQYVSAKGLARDTAKLRKHLKAAQEQQKMTAMMSMLSPPKVKSFSENSSKTNNAVDSSSNTISLEDPKVEFETNPLALLPLLSSSGGNMNSMLPLLLLMK